MKFVVLAFLFAIALSSNVVIQDCGDSDTLAHFQNITATDVKPGGTTTIVTGKSTLLAPISSGTNFFEGWLNNKSLGGAISLCMFGTCDVDFAIGLGHVFYEGPTEPQTTEWSGSVIKIKFPVVLLPGQYKIEARGIAGEGDEAFCLRFTFKY